MSFLTLLTPDSQNSLPLPTSTGNYQPQNALIENFSNPDGSFSSSVCLDGGQFTQIPFQRHVDIRSFIQEDINFPNENVFIAGENWQVPEGASSPTIGLQSGYNNHYGISWPLIAGINSVWSVSAPVDIYTGFEDLDVAGYISLACPAWPSEINIYQSYIDFTADPGGSFGPAGDDPGLLGPLIGYDNISSVALTRTILPTDTGDVEIRIPRTQIPLASLTNITGIRLRLWATGSCTFTCLAIRFLPATWKVAPLDLNTRLKALVPPVTRAGTLGAIEFPTATASEVITTDWPVLYRQTSANSSPVDISHSVRIYSGEMASGNTNKINLYYRTITNEVPTQSSLDNLIMSQLDNLSQPDIANNGAFAGYLDTFQTDYSQQFNEIPSSSGDWIEIDLIWTATGSTLIVQNRDNINYSWTPTIVANTYYLLSIDLIGTSIRLRIWESDASGSVLDTQVIDSTVINDSELIANRPGLIGWYAQFQDGNAACYGLAANYTSFGSYISKPVQSQTPVVGSSIYTETTPNLILSDQLYNGLYGGMISPDISKSPTASRITITGGNAGNQGIQTTPFWIYDWNNTIIQFRLFVTNSNINNPLKIVLISQDNETIFDSEQSLITNQNNIEINFPFYSPGVWQNYTFYTEAYSQMPTGFYTFNVFASNLSQIFWIDNFKIFTRNYSWFIRNGILDENQTLLGRTSFMEAKDSVNMGASLDSHTTSFQILAEQLQSDTQIQGLAIMPYYANRNRLVWDN